METKFELLSKEILPTLIGKTIEWRAPIYRYNQGYYGLGLDGGICKIVEIEIENRKPIISAEIIAGSDIKYAFQCDGDICFTDSDRLVSYRMKS